MKIAYIGTPSFAAELLSLLIKESASHAYSVAYVITQPDKPVGRKKITTPSPVKGVAQDHSIPCYTSMDILIKDPVDLAILFAYGKIVPSWALQSPKLGFWNIHPSALPKYRGASPIAFPLLVGETSTAVTLMQMDEELDHGPIITAKPLSIDSETMRRDIEKTIPIVAISLIKDALGAIQRGERLQHTPQDHNNATYTRLLDRSDGYIPYSLFRLWSTDEDVAKENYPEPLLWWHRFNTIPLPDKLPARVILRNMYRALHGWPGMWTNAQIQGADRRMKILDADIKNSSFVPLRVQLEGKKPVPYEVFESAYL